MLNYNTIRYSLENEREMNEDGEVVETPVAQTTETEQNDDEELTVEDKVPDTNPLANLQKTEQEAKALKVQVPGAESLESFSFFTPGTNFMEALSTAIGKFSKMFSDSIDRVTQFISTMKFGKGGRDNLVRYAEKTNYFSVAKTTKVYQVPRLGVKWLDYVKYLRELAQVVVKIDKEMILPFDDYLAKAINKPDLLSSFNYRPKYQKQDLEGMRKKLEACFNGPATEKALWGVAFSKNTDVKEFVAILNETRTLCETLKPETVKKSVMLLTKHADIIQKGIADKSSKYQLNAKTASHISDLLYDCALSVEFYAVVLQLVFELDQLVHLTAKQLPRA